MRNQETYVKKDSANFYRMSKNKKLLSKERRTLAFKIAQRIDAAKKIASYNN